MENTQTIYVWSKTWLCVIYGEVSSKKKTFWSNFSMESKKSRLSDVGTSLISMCLCTVHNTHDSERIFTASLQSGVSPVGTVAGGFAMDRWGRRFTMRAGLLPLFIGYMIIAFAPSHLTVLIGRFITAISGGFSAAASSVSMKSVRFSCGVL